MASLNRVVLIGNITRDLDLRYTERLELIGQLVNKEVNLDEAIRAKLKLIYIGKAKELKGE